MGGEFVANCAHGVGHLVEGVWVGGVVGDDGDDFAGVDGAGYVGGDVGDVEDDLVHGNAADDGDVDVAELGDGVFCIGELAGVAVGVTDGDDREAAGAGGDKSVAVADAGSRWAIVHCQNWGRDSGDRQRPRN